MCEVITRAYCTECEHSFFKHSRESYTFKKIKVEYPDITRYEEERTRVYKLLVGELVRFQSVVSYFSTQRKCANDMIGDLLKRVKDIPSFDGKDVAINMLDDMIKIAKYPYSDKSGSKEARINWSCGILDVVHVNITEQNIKESF